MRACAQPNLTPSWVQSVKAQGWHLIPTWVGPQAPCSKFSIVIPTDPTQAVALGITEADAATTAASTLGISAPAPIYYDMEAYQPGDPCSAAVQAFTRMPGADPRDTAALDAKRSAACGP